MKSTNSDKGRNARASGRELEAVLRNTHALYEARGIGRVVQRTALAHSRSSIGDGSVDFRGKLDGTVVAFDAKQSARTATYRHPENRFHQLVALRRVQAQGGAAFLLVFDPLAGYAFIISDLSRLLKGEGHQISAGGTSDSFVPLVPIVPLTGARGNEQIDWWPVVQPLFILARDAQR